MPNGDKLQIAYTLCAHQFKVCVSFWLFFLLNRNQQMRKKCIRMKNSNLQFMFQYCRMAFRALMQVTTDTVLRLFPRPFSIVWIVICFICIENVFDFKAFSIRHSLRNFNLNENGHNIFMALFPFYFFLWNCIMPHVNILSVTGCRKNYENVFIWAHIKTIFHRNFCGYVSHSVKCSHMNRKWIAYLISLSMHTIWFGFYENMQIYATNSNKCFWMGKQKTFFGVTTISNGSEHIEKEILEKGAFVCLHSDFFFLFFFSWVIFAFDHWNMLMINFAK